MIVLKKCTLYFCSWNLEDECKKIWGWTWWISRTQRKSIPQQARKIFEILW